MFSKMVSDENVEKVAKSKFSGLPNFQYAGGALHLGSCAGLIGDAIHTVKPYFGMGVNSAFEDVTVLEECIENAKGDSKIFLPLYSKKRAADAKALVDQDPQDRHGQGHRNKHAKSQEPLQGQTRPVRFTIDGNSS